MIFTLFQDNEKLYIFLEIMIKGSVATLYPNDGLMESQVSSYTQQTLNGLKYLHDKNLIHRDIKCANILVDESGSVKLADFGLAKASEMNAAKSFKGTLLWTAPEVFKNVNNISYGLAADIWSLGCAVLEMLTRGDDCPKHDSLRLSIDLIDLSGSYEQAVEKFRKGEPSPLPKSLSKNGRDFIRRCLRRNPKNQPSAAQLLDHPFVKNEKSLFEGCLTTPTLSPTHALHPPSGHSREALGVASLELDHQALGVTSLERRMVEGFEVLAVEEELLVLGLGSGTDYARAAAAAAAAAADDSCK
ncbi:hypothetical protein BT93_G0639 [Corymbia citriodora subsp. variegata]|nr:hypothetical protein BT93_G0639 [Corymbia citriodora subsp. variegata]